MSESNQRNLRPRVLIADDHAIGEGTRALLVASCEVIGR
jgi:hypothetical protein